MLKMLKQARAALGMLNPEEVRKKVERPIHFALLQLQSSLDNSYEGRGTR